MAKVVKLDPKPRSFESPVQFDFFGLDDPRLTHTIALWDVAPRWVFRHGESLRDGEYLKTIKRNFAHAGKVYGIALKPARIERDGKEIEQYPGEREQLVEEVIRRIAVMRNRLTHSGQDEVGVTFSLYEVRKELERTGHAFSFYEILEALHVLHHSTVRIVRVDDNGTGEAKERVVSASAFPQLRLAEAGSENSATTIQFNWLVSKALAHLEFRQVDYEVIMRMKGPIERWVYKRINHDVLFHRGSVNVYVIRASEIIDGCGMAQWKRVRDSLRRVTEAVMAMKAQGVIAEVEARDIFEGRRKIDTEYTITASQAFSAQLIEALRTASTKVEDYLTVVGDAPTEFVPTDAEKRNMLRKLRSRQVSERMEQQLAIKKEGQ